MFCQVELKWESLVGFSLGSEGPVVVCTGGRGDPMGDHCPCRLETTCQTVHERGCILGRKQHWDIDSKALQATKNTFEMKRKCWFSVGGSPRPWNQPLPNIPLKWAAFEELRHTLTRLSCSWWVSFIRVHSYLAEKCGAFGESGHSAPRLDKTNQIEKREQIPVHSARNGSVQFFKAITSFP